MNVVNLVLMVVLALILAIAAAVLPKRWSEKVADFFRRWEEDIEGMVVLYAAANTKSTEVTNADATPPVKTHVSVSHGRLHTKVGTIEIAAADDAASVYRMCRVHSSWRLDEITRYNDAITSGTGFDLGLYDITEAGGAAVDDDLFASGISLASESKTGVNDQFESASINIDDIEKPIWELLALSADPGKWYDLAYTGDTPGSGAGTLSVRVRYVAND
jgi:hypothetical protein